MYIVKVNTQLILICFLYIIVSSCQHKQQATEAVSSINTYITDQCYCHTGKQVV